MNVTDQLCYEMMSLLFDAPAPLSVLFPEARAFLPQTRAIDIGEALDWLQAASGRRWLTLTVDDMDGSPWPYRPPDAADFIEIADEYRQGLRDADEVLQILDRTDLWLEISPEGKSAVDAAWAEMPEQSLDAEHGPHRSIRRLPAS